jgi:hypothetical protein
MKRLARCNNLLIATLWQKQLEAGGITCEIRNRYLAGATGELPPDQVGPELWVAQERDYLLAQTLLKELQNPSPTPPWICRRCGESSEGQFGQCWHCQAMR